MLYMLGCTGFLLEGYYKFGLHYLDFTVLCLFAIAIIYIISLGCKIPAVDLTDPFEKMIVAFFAILALQLFYTYKRYSQPLAICVKMAYYYLVIYLYCLLKLMSHNELNKIDFSKLLVRFSILCNFYVIISYFGRGVKMCPHFYLLLLSFPIAMSYILYKENFYLGLTLMITSLAVYFTVLSSTAYILIYLGSILGLILYYTWEKYHQKNRLILVFVVASSVILMLMIGVIQSKINELITGEVGNQIRVYAIEYYLDKLKEQPFLGIGLVDPLFSIFNYDIVHGGISPLGGRGQYHLDDVGIIGFICNFGLSVLIVLFYLISGALKYIRESIGIYKAQNIGLCIVGLIMFISLCPFNKAPIQIVPCMLFLFYLNSKRRNKAEEE